MNLGFYYHIPILAKSEGFYLPGYLAVFINSLAKEVDQLTLFMHRAGEESLDVADYLITEKNIEWVDLGPKSPAWYRSLFPKSVLKLISPKIPQIDRMLVRSPSPLAPYFRRIPGLKDKITYLVVGDYKEGAIAMEINSIRDVFVKYYVIWNHFEFMKALSNASVIVNSKAQFNKLKKLTTDISEIKTTTLGKDDFYYRKDSIEDLTNEINILYTGRVVKEKGLDLILEACVSLKDQGYFINFHIAGMLVKGKEDYIQEIQAIALKKGFNNLFFHGMKKVGPELNALYRMAQIYVLASISDFEGFPRTIWEAMANSCPVIATKVGSIPYYLQHRKNAYLVATKSVIEITAALKDIIEDENLRCELIREGQILAESNTLERQTKILVSTLAKYNH